MKHKLYINNKYYKYIHNIRQINNSYNIYYELIIPKELSEDIIRESNPHKCIDCYIDYNNYYKKITLFYTYLCNSNLNNNIILKIKTKLIKTDNLLEEIFYTGHNCIIYYDHICNKCINKNNKDKIIINNFNI